EESITRTYESLQGTLPPSTIIDSLEVVKQVEQYRQFWRPEKTNAVLLAESHVYTDETDFKITCSKSPLHGIVPNYPLRFVRFVYCLGYGENELLNKVRTDRKNTGTPQYWKIFSSCVAENEDDLGFAKILKTRTRSLTKRLRNKVDVLRKMRKKGIWLLDASIVGLYGSGKKDYAMMERILRICWQNYMANIISESSPKHLIVIGKSVGRILDRHLRNSGIPFTVIPQPQARGSSEWQLENYRKYQRMCAQYD
ncbi:MAG: hypothetical protein ACFFH0_13010, partial [Promethearchaeota archaeon]